MDGQECGEERGIDKSALPTSDSYTSRPEQNLQPGDPKLVGGAPPEEKKGMAEKVKGLFGGMRKGHGHGDTDSAVGSGVGHTPEAGGGDECTGRSGLDPTSPAPVDEGTDPQGVTNEQGGAALTDERGNLKPGPHQDAVKREGVLSKIKDKFHGSK